MTPLQVLVYHDLLGMMQHPHYVKVTPKFCKQYASVGTVIQEALQSYRDEVQPVLPGSLYAVTWARIASCSSIPGRDLMNA